MSSAEKFVSILKEKKLVPEKVVDALEKQVAQRSAAGRELTAKELAAALVKQKLLTETQAKSLTAEAESIPAARADFAAELEAEMGLEAMPPAGGGLDSLDDAAMNAHDPLGPAPVSKKKKKGLFGNLADSGASSKKGGKKRKLEKKQAKENPWDSKLMILGGGALLLFVLMGGALYFALTWQSADELYDLAEEDYKRASYTQAIEKYDKFVARFPKHISVSRAKVHRGLSKMRQVVDPAKNASQFAQALTEAKTILAEIGPESAFGEASADLSAMLPKIAGGLSQAAMETLSPGITAEAEEAVKLVDRYAPKEGTSPKMSEARSQIEVARRNTSRDEELKKSVVLIREKLAADDTAAAYALRTALVRDFTDLTEDPRLLRVTLEIAEKERELIRFVPEVAPAGNPVDMAAKNATGAGFSAENVALIQPASVSSGNTAGAGEVVRLVAAPDAIYAMNAMNGTVFWRYSLRGNLRTRTPQNLPVWVREEGRAGKAGNDLGLLAVDAKNQTLNFIAKETLQWTQKIGEKVSANVMTAGTEALVASTSGKLHAFRVPEGGKVGFYQFQQPLVTAPARDAERGMLYQIAEHSNMFALVDAERDGKPCVRVYHVGHRAGEVLLPPMVVGDFVLVMMKWEENTQVKVYPRAEAAPHALLLDSVEDAALVAAVAPVQEFTITGSVDATPQVMNNRVLLVSDTGEMQVWSISAANEHEPFQVIARGSGQDTGRTKTGVNDASSPFFPLLNANEVYVAGTQLERFDIQATNNRLQSRWVVNTESVTLQPLEWIAAAKTLMHVRLVKNREGMNILAVETAQGRAQWDIQLAVPFITEPTILADGRVLVCTQSGAIFDVTEKISEMSAAAGGKNAPPGKDAVLQDVIGQAPAEYVPQQVAQSFCDENGNFVLLPAGQSRQLLIFSDKEKRFQAKSVSDVISGTLLPFQTAIFVPCQKGQIFLMDRLEGTMKATPFQPKLRGEDFVWKLAQIGTKSQWIAADNHARLYRFSLQKGKEKGLPALLEDASVKLEASVVGEIAFSGENAYFVDEKRQLCSFQPLARELKVTVLARLKEDVTAGPWVFGNTLVAENETGEMLAWDMTGKSLWKKKLPTSPPAKYTLLAGKPVMQDGRLVCATVDGIFFSVDVRSGAVLKAATFDDGFRTSATVFGGKFLVGTSSGCLAVMTENAGAAAPAVSDTVLEEEEEEGENGTAEDAHAAKIGGAAGAKKTPVVDDGDSDSLDTEDAQ